MDTIEAPLAVEGGSAPLDLNQGFWFCLYTKPRMEYRVRQALETRGRECYLPEAHRTARDCRQGIRRPFFPRYFFARLIPAQDLAWVRWTPGLVCLLSFGGSPVVVEDAVIEALRARLAARLEVEAVHGPFCPGERVRVTAGPFQGLEAVFDRRLSPNGRARILVEFLHRTASCVIDISYLAKMD